MSIEEQCKAAMRRITEQINRSAGQHRRAIAKAFERARA